MRKNFISKICYALLVLFLGLYPCAHAEGGEWKTGLLELQTRIDGQLKELTKEKEELEEMNKSLLEKLSQTSSEREVLKTQLEFLMSKLEESRANNIILQKVVNSLKQERVQLEKELADLNEDYSFFKEESDSLKAEFKTAYTELTKALSQKEIAIKDIESTQFILIKPRH